MEPLCLAVDIGGTKMAAALVDRQGELTHADHVPTADSDDPEVVWAPLQALISSVAAHAPAGAIEVCGVGCGGPMELGGATVSPLNIGAWREFPLRARLAELAGVPTQVDNDAKALALGEGWRGAAVGCANYLAMVVSTGVGGGIVLDGALLDGRLGNAGTGDSGSRHRSRCIPGRQRSRISQSRRPCRGSGNQSSARRRSA